MATTKHILSKEQRAKIKTMANGLARLLNVIESDPTFYDRKKRNKEITRLYTHLVNAERSLWLLY